MKERQKNFKMQGLIHEVIIENSFSGKITIHD